VQVTVLEPGGNVLPLAGVHAVATGGTPLTIVGVAYTTEIGWANGARSVIGAGHVIFGGPGTGGGTGVGCVGGDELQPWTARVHTSTLSARRQKRVG